MFSIPGRVKSGQAKNRGGVMASFNRVILLGNLTRDIELKYTANQTAVTDIGLAVNDRRKTANGEWVDETTFVDVTLWGRTAEIASQYLSKGSPVLIEGRLKLDTWESPKGRSDPNCEWLANACSCSESDGAARRIRLPRPMLPSRRLTTNRPQSAARDDIPF